MTTIVAPPPDTPEAPERPPWGKRHDLNGTAYFSVVIDPDDAAETCTGGISQLMGYDPVVLAAVLCEQMDEEQWFYPLHVLWGVTVAEYSDETPVQGVICTMIIEQ